MRRECEREGEVLEIVRSGRSWSACDPELSDHVAACALCADLVAVASALLTGHDQAFRGANVPSSGLVWWRAQRRARQEAVTSATRVATAIQAISMLSGVALVIAVFGLDAITAPVQLLEQWAMPLMLAIVTWLALTPVALLVVFKRE